MKFLKKDSVKTEGETTKESKQSKRGEEQMKQIITRYRKSPYELAKYTMGDIWNNIPWYQKLYYRIYCEWIRRIYK